MERPISSARVDWRPYYVTAVTLGFAIAMNLATGNGLWLWYTTIGTGVFLVVVSLVHHQRWPVPNVAAWIVGLCAGLHYVGGSLSGLHQVGGVNGLYFAFPWWDNVVHFLACAAMGVAAYAILESRTPQVGVPLRVVLAISVASLIGVLVELYEFAQFVFLATVDQGFYSNNLLDLYYNLIGASAGSIAYARTRRSRPAASSAAAPGPAMD